MSSELALKFQAFEPKYSIARTAGMVVVTLQLDGVWVKVCSVDGTPWKNEILF